MSLLPIEEALARVLAGIARPVAAETVAIAAAHGRTLAVDAAPRRPQPPLAPPALLPRLAHGGLRGAGGRRRRGAGATDGDRQQRRGRRLCGRRRADAGG